jgi:hypothetical protein
LRVAVRKIAKVLPGDQVNLGVDLVKPNRILSGAISGQCAHTESDDTHIEPSIGRVQCLFAGVLRNCMTDSGIETIVRRWSHPPVTRIELTSVTNSAVIQSALMKWGANAVFIDHHYAKKTARRMDCVIAVAARLNKQRNN